MLKDRFQISLLVIIEFKQINEIKFYSPLKSLEILGFSDGFIGNRSELICLNSINIRSEILRRSLNQHNYQNY